MKAYLGRHFNQQQRRVQQQPAAEAKQRIWWLGHMLATNELN
jgi:hypothetical protein